MADLLFPRGAFNTANLAAPAQGQTDTRYLINNTVISDGFVWRCRVDNPTSAPSDSNTTEWEKRSATNVQVWANDATTAIPANKLSNAGSAGAGFLFGDDARFVFSTTSDTFSTRTFTGITNVGTSTYIILDNLVEGGVTTQPAFDQLRNILLGDHTSGRTPQDHTFNMIPSSTSIVVPAGTFINSGQSTGGRGAIEFTFTGTNPFTNNIANQTGFIHIGAQARVGTLIAGRGLEGDVNGSLLTLDVNVPDNAVTSVSPQVLVNYTSIDTSLIQGAEVTVNFNNEAAAVRLIEHFGREAPNGSVSVHETTVLRINTGTPDATTFNLMTGDELRLTGLESNDAVSFFFDTVARAQSFATALGTSGGSFSIDANTRVVHSIADGSNTEIRRLTDDQNVLTNNIAVDLNILQADGNDPANGQMAVYDTAQDPDRWIAVNPDTRDIVLSNSGANVNIGDLVRGFTSSGNEPTDVYLATTTANGLMASATVPVGWLHLNTGRLDNVLDQAPTWPSSAPADSSQNFTVRTGDYYQVGSIVFIAIDEIAVTATNYASVTPADNNPFWRIINGHSNAATYPTSSVNFDATGTPDLHIERATIWVFNNNVWFWNGSDTTVSNAAGRTANEPSSTNNNWIQLNGGTGGGSTTFLGLTDTPSTFGTAGQVVVVNSGANGLTFADGGTGGGPTGVPNFVQTATGEYGLRRFEARQLELTIPDSAYVATSGTNRTIDVGRGTGATLARTGNLTVNSPQTFRAAIAGNSGLDSFTGVTADLNGNVITINGPADTYRIRSFAPNIIDFSQITTNLGTINITTSGNTTEFTVVSTQAELDASTTWQEITTDTPFWNSRSAYAVGNEVIDDNRLFKCNNPVTASSAATQHITSDQIVYISNPIDNAENFLRFTFNRDETVIAGTYRYRFFDNDGNLLTGSFAHNHIEDDSGNAIGINMSSNRWLINYDNITQTMGTLPTTFTDFTSPDADIQNGSAANTHPAVTPDNWTEIASVDDTRILDHSSRSSYVPGQIVTDSISKIIFRCIDGIDGATGIGDEFTDLDVAHIVDDNSVISLRIRFRSDHRPVPLDEDVNNNTVRWTLTANLHTGEATSISFLANAVIDGPTGSTILGHTESNIWHIRIDTTDMDLIIADNFPTTVTGNDSVDFLDVSHASVHTGNFNERPGADPVHWERIGSDLPNTPNQEDGNFVLNQTTIPAGDFSPDLTTFAGGGDATADATGSLRLGGGTQRQTVSTTGVTTLTGNNVFFSTRDASSGNFIATYRSNPTITPGDVRSILFPDGITNGGALRTAAAPSGDTNHMLVYVDAVNWALFEVSDTAGISNIQGFGNSAKTVTLVPGMSMGDLDGNADIVFGDSSINFTVAAIAPRIVHSWQQASSGGGIELWQGARDADELIPSNHDADDPLFIGFTEEIANSNVATLSGSIYTLGQPGVYKFTAAMSAQSTTTNTRANLHLELRANNSSDVIKQVQAYIRNDNLGNSQSGNISLTKAVRTTTAGQQFRLATYYTNVFNTPTIRTLSDSLNLIIERISD